MADIRINALATTAASTASDDFIAVDGSANGTRKLNAYSPTFGGNVVATGTLTVNGTTDSSSKDTGAIVTEGGLGVEKSATIGGNLTVSGTGTNSITATKATGGQLPLIYTGDGSYSAWQIQNSNGFVLFGKESTSGGQLFSTATANAGVIAVSGANNFELSTNNTKRLTIDGSTGAATLAGNLTVSGTGTSTFGGNIAIPATYALYLNGSGGDTYLLEATGDKISAVVGGAQRAYFGESNSYISNNLLIGKTTPDTGEKLQVSGTAAISGGIVGTTTNDSAAAGIVGQYVSSTVLSASAVSLTNGVAANITSISLTAGDWDVTGLAQYNFTGATCSYVYHGFTTASAAFGAANSYVQDYRNYIIASVSTHSPTLTFRISLAATTTIYFVTQADFSAGTVGAYGVLRARRVR